MSGHTPGPWGIGRYGDITDTAGEVIRAKGLALTRGDEAEANARLIAAAPDHALLIWAMCVGAGRWEPMGASGGEFCMNGLRHYTSLDEFGCPAMTAGMREAIRSAGGHP